MPEFKELFPKSFRARDFRDGPAVLTIKSVEPRQLEDEKKGTVSTKLCVKFEETSRFWFAGPKEACPSIADALGSTNTDDWIGKRIELFETETEFGDDVVDCFRARKPSDDAPPVEKKATKKRAVRAKAKDVYPSHVGDDDEGNALVKLEEGGEIYEVEQEDLAGVLDGSIELE